MVVKTGGMVRGFTSYPRHPLDATPAAACNRRDAVTVDTLTAVCDNAKTNAACNGSDPLQAANQSANGRWRVAVAYRTTSNV
jgi:hypothetical protein